MYQYCLNLLKIYLKHCKTYFFNHTSHQIQYTAAQCPKPHKIHNNKEDYLLLSLLFFSAVPTYINRLLYLICVIMFTHNNITKHAVDIYVDYAWNVNLFSLIYQINIKTPKKVVQEDKKTSPIKINYILQLKHRRRSHVFVLLLQKTYL